jgi:SAM-dependent methyltransferase
MSNFVTRTQCPGCKSEQLKVLLDKPYDSGVVFDFLIDKYTRMGAFEPELLTGERYVLVECLDCNMLFQQQRPSDALLSTVYSKWINYDNAFQRNENTRGNKAGQYNAEFIVLDLWAKQKKLKVLDYGMGHGRWLEAAYVHGHHPFGYEYDVHRNERPNAIYTAIELDEITKHQFDFINTEQVFEHLAEPLETLQMLAKALRPGGLVRISVPSAIETRGKVHQNMLLDFSHTQKKLPMKPLEPLQHLNLYAGKAMASMAAQAGLQPWFPPLSWLIGSKQDWSSLKKVAYNLLQPTKIQVLYKHQSPMRYFVKPK